ncbi:hypothetical protein LCGC14_1246800 [marine sediment metagenome]|uniref:Uncharacterized protein n=1 Tax=marine sediment metagenome TaxID=412755 RepID=A0A0F9L493_9ZZZZ
MALHHPLDTSVFRLETGEQVNPSPGDEFIWTPPTFSRVLILGVSFVFAAAAGGPARLMHIMGNDGTDDFQPSINFVNQLANTTITHDYTPNITGADFMTTYLHLHSVLVWPVFLQVGDTLQSITSGIQAADQFSLIRIRYAAWQDT